MIIESFNIFRKKAKPEKIIFQLGETIRHKSNNRLGRIDSIGSNINKPDELWIDWYDENISLEDALQTNPKKYSRYDQDGEEVFYTSDEIKKLTPEEQEFIDNLGEYNL
jgi:hypothetical protein